MSRVFAKHGLRFDVEISSGQVGNDRSHPYIKAGSWIKALDKAGKLWKFLGLGPEFNDFNKCKPALLDFWEKFRLMHGGHQIYNLAAAGALKLECCVPCLIHGDEGTTYKKDACFVLSYHAIIGQGTISNKLGPIEDGNPPALHTNFVGHAFQTRFLLGSLLRELRHCSA